MTAPAMPERRSQTPSETAKPAARRRPVLPGTARMMADREAYSCGRSLCKHAGQLLDGDLIAFKDFARAVVGCAVHFGKRERLALVEGGVL